MAKKLGKKRPAPPPPPPPAPPSSSSDEEESSSGSQEPITKSPNPKTPTNNQEADGESESGSSDEETVAKSPVPKTPPNNKGEGTDDGSESDSGDDKEDEEEAEKPRPDTKKPESVCTAAAAAASSALKPSDAGEKSNKKGKDSAKGKSLFQRIWSLDDEITILKGIIEFESKHGRYKRDGAGIRDFHHFVKDSLSLEVNDTQLYEKIRGLKRKYETAAARARKMGKAVMSGKPHDEKVYELSEEIWGAAGNENGARVNSKRAAKRRAAAVVANDGGWGSLKRKYLFFNEALVNAGQDVSAEVLAALDPEKAMLFENKFKKQRVEDLKCNIQELDLVKQALNSIVEEIESTVD